MFYNGWHFCKVMYPLPSAITSLFLSIPFILQTWSSLLHSSSPYSSLWRAHFLPSFSSPPFLHNACSDFYSPSILTAILPVLLLALPPFFCHIPSPILTSALPPSLHPSAISPLLFSLLLFPHPSILLPYPLSYSHFCSSPIPPSFCHISSPILTTALPPSLLFSLLFCQPWFLSSSPFSHRVSHPALLHLYLSHCCSPFFHHNPHSALPDVSLSPFLTFLPLLSGPGSPFFHHNVNSVILHLFNFSSSSLCSSSNIKPLHRLSLLPYCSPLPSPTLTPGLPFVISPLHLHGLCHVNIMFSLCRTWSFCARLPTVRLVASSHPETSQTCPWQSRQTSSLPRCVSVSLFQTAHSWAKAGILLRGRMRRGVAFVTVSLSGWSLCG